MKKKVSILFLLLLMGMFVYSQDKDSETIFGIKTGADFATVDSVLKSKGFSMVKSSKESEDITLCAYSGGLFANTKPQAILMTISKIKGLVACDIGWPYDYYLNLDKSLDDDALNRYLENKDAENVMKRVCYKNKSEFGTLINSLNKKYNCNISLPDYYEKFFNIVYSGENLSIGYGFTGGNTVGECRYKLTFISKYYEGSLTNDL